MNILNWLTNIVRKIQGAPPLPTETKEPSTTNTINGKLATIIQGTGPARTPMAPQPSPSLAPSPTAIPSIQPTPVMPFTPTAQNGDPYQSFINNVSKGSIPKPKPLPSDLSKAIKNASASTGVPANLLAALADTETNLRNIKENSGIGAQGGRGYFQIDLTQHPHVTEQQAMDPNFAAEYAAHLLNNNVKAFKDSKTPVIDAIQAYNGGYDRSNWSNNITQGHLKKVLSNLSQYNYNP